MARTSSEVEGIIRTATECLSLVNIRRHGSTSARFDVTNQRERSSQAHQALLVAGSSMSVLLLALQVLYLFAPLLLSLLLSALVTHFDLYSAYFIPVDGGRIVHGHRLFGDHKTWRGFLVAILGCMLGSAVQMLIPVSWTGQLAVIEYARVNPFALGAAMGGGAMLGELPNSFLKRQLGIAPGATASGFRSTLFYVWDQVDTLTGVWPLLLPWLHPSASLVAMSFVVALTVHPFASWIGYLLGVRKTTR